MNRFLVALCLFTAFAAQASADSQTASPITKVIELLNGMADKVKAEEAAAAKIQEESKAFCEKRADELNYAIKTGKSSKEDLTSRIENAKVKISEAGNVIEETMASIQTAESELTAATDVRNKERKDFSAEEKELVDTMATLEKALLVLQKQEASGKSASLLQVQRAPNVMAAVDAMVSASMISTGDAAGLSSLLQKFKAQDEEFQPDPAAYEKKSGGVIELIEDLYDKSKGELAELRKKETGAVNSFDMTAQALNDEIKFRTEEQEKARAQQAEQNKLTSDTQKELDQTLKDLSADKKELKDLEVDCKRKAEEYAADSKDRSEELTAVGTAIDALKDKAMGASSQQYGLNQEAASFLQLTAKAEAQNSHFKIVHLLRSMAKSKHSDKIALLAQKIGVAIRADHSARGPFDTIVKMIQDMIANMQKSLQEDSDKKQYCDSEREKVKAKKDDKQSEVDKLASKIDSATSKSVQLKNEVQDTQAYLSELAQDSKEMTKIRAEEKAAFAKNAPEMQAGLEGVKIALKVLREYYEKSGKRGGATGIIGMLEVCESDFSKSLSDMKIAEKSAQKAFEKEQKDMKLEKVTKEQDVKYKTEEAARLDASVTEIQADADSVGEEMAAIIEYSKGIEEQCTETQESFAEKAAKRQEEIDGLKTALKTLSDSGLGFLQIRSLRGQRQAVMAPF
eukprot:TRINITY_DN245_c0_g2_i1.p1 TRINITY_DN245_c0_g2~~TRINITY_DN245_c0_g2_i1.p1  ORF type:complete len:683 (-),score=267.61 TRINITY_DN245_c0_g2_i1:90-2138(-)